jgi:hypothetical protein
MSQYNPYAAPQAGPATPQVAGYGGGAPQGWEIGEVLQHAWNVFKPDWATLVFTLFLSRVIAGIPSYIPAVLLAARVIRPNTPEYWTTYGICSVIGLFVTAFFQVGLVKIWTDAARGVTPQFADLFGGGRRYFAMLGAMVLFILSVLVGYIFLIVPGIIVALGLAFTYFFVVDQNMGPIDALGASWQATKGHKGNLFLFFLVCGLLWVAGVFACCVGVLVAFPVTMIAMATVYLRITGRGYGPPAAGVSPGYPPPAFGQGPGGYGPPPQGYP